MVLLLVTSARTATAQPQSHLKTPYAYCGRTFKSLVVFQLPDFKSAEIAPLACGQQISVISEHGSWARIRVLSGVVGYEPVWFVGPSRAATVSKSAKCNRPSPLANLDQFERLQADLDRYIDDERFTVEDFKSISREDTENLAASSYLAAYLTAENPHLLKDTISKAVVDNQIFGKDFPKLSPIEQINVEIWLQKMLDVMSKAMDLGFKDGSKYPCSAK
jgi:hypothetical protein